MSSKGFTRLVSGVLDEYLRRSGIHANLAEKELISRWSEVVGEAISNEVELVDVDAGTLLLRTSNPSWKTEIIFQKRTILAKANAVLSTGKFRDIRFI